MPRKVHVEVLELPFPPTGDRTCTLERSPLGTFADCPMCGGSLAPEHAHFRCTGCGWRDSCCD
jgi:hypothetical protein